MLTKILAALGNKTAIRCECAKKVKEAFDGVNLPKQSFIYNGIKITDSEGEFIFYRAKEIDSAIEKLNKVLNELVNGE